MTRSARFRALLKGSSLNGVDVSRVGLNNEAGFGESKRSEANGLKTTTTTKNNHIFIRRYINNRCKSIDGNLLCPRNTCKLSEFNQSGINSIEGRCH